MTTGEDGLWTMS